MGILIIYLSLLVLWIPKYTYCQDTTTTVKTEIIDLVELNDFDFKNVTCQYETVNEVKHGKLIYYTEEGKVIYLENYKNGKLEGLATTFNLDGKVNSVVEYYKGQFHGIQLTYYNSGNLRWIMYYNQGSLDGLSINLYETGEIGYIRNYVNGKTEGAIRHFHKNGTLWKLAYKNELGNDDGIMKEYDEHGTLIRIELYENGILVPIASE